MYGALDYFEQLLVFVFVVSGCVLIYSSALLVGIFVGITNSAMWLTISAIAKMTWKMNWKITSKSSRKRDKCMIR